VEVACLGAQLAACPRGATLLFAARTGAPAGYLAAWAEPATGGQRIWYFSADEETPRVDAAIAGTRPLSRGVRIGPEHAPGRYRVHVVLSAQPLSKAALTGATPPAVKAADEIPLTIVEPAP